LSPLTPPPPFLSILKSWKNLVVQTFKALSFPLSGQTKRNTPLCEWLNYRYYFHLPSNRLFGTAIVLFMVWSRLLIFMSCFSPLQCNFKRWLVWTELEKEDLKERFCFPLTFCNHKISSFFFSSNSPSKLKYFRYDFPFKVAQKNNKKYNNFCYFLLLFSIRYIYIYSF